MTIEAPNPALAASEMKAILARQRAAFNCDDFPDLATRRARLARMVDMLLAHEQEIISAQQQDFPGKSEVLIRLGEMLGPISAIRYIAENLEGWMKPETVPLAAELEAIGMRAKIQFQPLGVVGVISPWNGPIILSCLPLAGILAAGNRAMIKMSEYTPTVAALFADMVRKYFDPIEVAVFTGGPEVAIQFTQLAFDHLLYTGSTRVAREVMKAAAENLVPVTLELGGKSPVIVGRSADLERAIPRLTYGKVMHAGQVCVTPDYLLAPRDQVDFIADRILAAVDGMYPNLAANADYGPVLNRDRFERLSKMVDDARARGSRVLLSPEGQKSLGRPNALRFPLHIIIEPDDDSLAMSEEIFGPILPIKGYDHLDQALSYINGHPRPLAAYYFGRDEDELRAIQKKVITGSMVVNDVVCQIFHEQLPFGGVGPSGMGRYRGKDGFRTFSNAMTVLIQSDRDDIVGSLRPPYGDGITTFIDQQLKPL